MLTRLIPSRLLSGLTALLIACGGPGGGAGNVSAPSTPSLSGVAAIGMALAKASVTLKDSTGKTETSTTDESGNFNFNNVSSLTPPLMLQVKGSAAGISYVLHSVMTSAPAQGTNTLNVTPATDALTTQTLGADPANIFADAEKIKHIDPQKLADTKAKLVAALKDAMANLNITDKDLMTGKFAADKTGMDKLFDLVEFSADSSTGAMKVTNKNTSVSATINSGTTLSEVKKIEVSKEEASFDLSGINKFVQSFVNSANNNDLSAIDKLLDENYLHQGMRLEKAKSSSSTNPSKISAAGYAIKKCDPSTKVCSGAMNVKIVDTGITYPIYMPIKLGTDGQWRAYGDQAPFQIDFYTAYTHSELIDSNSKTVTDVRDSVGFNLNFSGNSCSNCNDKKYKSSIFEMSTDGGKNYSSLFKLNSKTVINLDKPSSTIHLGLVDKNGYINERVSSDDLGPNILRFEDTQLINAYNGALQTGLLKLRITAYENADYQGSSVVWEPQVLYPLFYPTNFDSIIKSQQLTIDEKTLGTDSVIFNGKNLVVGNFRVSNWTKKPFGSYGTYGIGFAFEEVSALNGVVTLAKMKAQCMDCNSLTTEEFLFEQALLVSQNSQGGLVILSKTLKYK